jgi:hypothetical protein
MFQQAWRDFQAMSGFEQALVTTIWLLLVMAIGYGLVVARDLRAEKGRE